MVVVGGFILTLMEVNRDGGVFSAGTSDEMSVGGRVDAQKRLTGPWKRSRDIQ